MDVMCVTAVPQGERGVKGGKFTNSEQRAPAQNRAAQRRIKAREPIERYLTLVQKALASCGGTPVEFTEEDRKPLLVINTLLWMSMSEAGLLEAAKEVAENLPESAQLDLIDAS